MTKPIFLLIILIGVAGCKPKQETVSEEELLAHKIDSIYTAIPDFSGVVLFADEGDPIYKQAFGFRSFETNVPIETSDIFELASVSKQFTALGIMMLKEENKLNYDDLIEKYIPGLPYQGITIRNLLNHTSGLPDYWAVMDAYWDKSKVASNPDILEYLKKYSPPKNFEPGEKYSYSNTGYVLLGTIVEVVSGEDFVKFCQDKIFDPLQMTSTAIRSNEQKTNLTNLAYGHVYVPEKNRFVRADSFPSSNYTIWLGGRKGPGRVSSTVDDLLKWDQALYTNQLISQETLQDAFTPATLNDGSLSNYGFGWEIIPESEAGKVVWHNGDNPGYKTIIVRYLEAGKTLIVLSNNYNSQFEAARKAVDQIVGKDLSAAKN